MVDEATIARLRSINAGEWRERPDGFWELVFRAALSPRAEKEG